MCICCPGFVLCDIYLYIYICCDYDCNKCQCNGELFNKCLNRIGTMLKHVFVFVEKRFVLQSC